ncbi:MAG: cytochrome C assembly family protein [Candidatus Acidiferrales bacterium]
MHTILSYVTLALYAASLALYFWHLYGDNRLVGRLATLFLAAGIVVHYLALLHRSRALHSVPYQDIYGSISLFAWLIAVTYLGLEVYHRQRAVGSFVVLFLLAWLAVGMVIAPVRPPGPPPARGALFALHVTLNILAYSAFALSFILSLIYLVQNRILRARRPSRVLWKFPPLDLLEKMCRSSVAVGVLSLFLGAGMGLIWEHRLSGHYAFADFKVIITAFVLLVYAGYLWLARQTHWRGVRAARLCAFNFVFVLFSYTLVNLYLTGFHRYF